LPFFRDKFFHPCLTRAGFSTFPPPLLGPPRCFFNSHPIFVFLLLQRKQRRLPFARFSHHQRVTPFASVHVFTRLCLLTFLPQFTWFFPLPIWDVKHNITFPWFLPLLLKVAPFVHLTFLFCSVFFPGAFPPLSSFGTLALAFPLANPGRSFHIRVYVTRSPGPWIVGPAVFLGAPLLCPSRSGNSIKFPFFS